MSRQTPCTQTAAADCRWLVTGGRTIAASGAEDDGELHLLLVILGLGVSQSAGTAAIRVIQARSRDVYTSVLVNYVVGALLAGGYCLWRGRFDETWPTAVTLGVLAGGLYVAALLIVIHNMGQRGLAMTSALIGTSQLLPSVLALALGESLGPIQGAGLLVAAVAIPLLSTSTATGVAIRQAPRWRAALPLFVINGCAACLNLLASKHCGPASFPVYLTSLSVTATVVSGVVWRVWRRRALPGDVWRGVVFGLFNVIYTLTVLIAVKAVGGAVLFPGASVTSLTLTTALAVWWWRERLQRRGWIGLGLAAVAVAMLQARTSSPDAPAPDRPPPAASAPQADLRRVNPSDRVP